MSTQSKPGPHRRDHRFIRTGRAFVIYHPDGRIAAVGKQARPQRKVNR
jgi:hypothetical protein